MIATAADATGQGRDAGGNRCCHGLPTNLQSVASSCAIGLSIGVAMFPDDGADADTLLANADAALYRAKAEGRGTFRFFEAEMDQRLRERRALQHDLRTALERDELKLYFQPQARIERRGRRLRSAGALATSRSAAWCLPGDVHSAGRRKRPDRRRSASGCCARPAAKPPPGRSRCGSAVNLSPVQFRHGDLAALVHSILLETGLGAAHGWSSKSPRAS